MPLGTHTSKMLCVPVVKTTAVTVKFLIFCITDIMLLGWTALLCVSYVLRMHVELICSIFVLVQSEPSSGLLLEV